MVRLLLKLDYLIIFVISHNYFVISCHIWSFFFFVNYLSSSSCIFFVFPYILYSYILDILFLIYYLLVLEGILYMGIQFLPIAFLYLLYFYI